LNFHIKILFLFILPLTVFAVDIDPASLSSEIIKDFLEEQSPGGIYAEYSCPIVSSFSFDGNNKCSVSCRDYNAIIFTLPNVRKAYISRSSDRISLAIDIFSDGYSADSPTDYLASFSSSVSCIFNGLSPEFDKTAP